MEQILKAKLLRTIVYVDRLNFYYGQLKGTAWKWLDLPLLFENVQGKQNSLAKVKYFTAKVRPTSHDPDVKIRQDAYFRALKRWCEKVENNLF